MKIKSLKIDNFRCYQNEICINFDNMTAIIGKNDAGKSTILEALDIFFHDGKGLVKLDKDDINKIRKQKGDNDIKIAICFSKSQNPHFFCVPRLFHNTRFMTIIKLPVDFPFSTELKWNLL